jgi:SAM-dependent methyltransferase
VKTYELRACPACGSEDSGNKALCPHEHLRVCNKCGLVFAPAYGDPDELYVDGYHSGMGSATWHPLFQEFLSWVASRRLEIIERVVRPPGRFLDVGCGSGEVLAVAQRRGWQVQGAEPLHESAKLAQERGLDVRANLLQESGLPERSYDVVSAFHVLEHMTDGAAFLNLVARWARPGGYVVIEVQNFRSFHRLNHDRGLSWPGLRPLEHVAHYSPQTLGSALRRVGLEPVTVTTPTYLFPGQTLDQALDDLGLQQLRRVAGWMGRAGTHKGDPAVVPNPVGQAVLRTVRAAYTASRTGMVALAVARVG